MVSTATCVVVSPLSWVVVSLTRSAVSMAGICVTVSDWIWDAVSAVIWLVPRATIWAVVSAATLASSAPIWAVLRVSRSAVWMAAICAGVSTLI